MKYTSEQDKALIYQNSQITQQVKEWYYIVASLHNILLENPMDPRFHFVPRFGEKHLGLINEDDHCLKADSYKLVHPEVVLDELHVFTEFGLQKLGRKIIREISNDTRPSVSTLMSKSLASKQIFTFPLNSTITYTHETKFLSYHEITKHHVCMFESFNHVPGKFSITGKDYVVNNYMKYMQHFKNKNATECIKTIRFIPRSFRLYNQSECKEFFFYINTQEYKELRKANGAVFVSKFGRDVHKGKGVTDYNNGIECGKETQVMIIQKYISNPLLYKGHKLEFRIYFLIASTDPLIIYSQNWAHIKKCGVLYDKFSKKKEVHVCNTAILTENVINKNQNDNNNSNNNNEEQEDDDEYIIDWHLDYLEKYLIQQGKIKENEDWLKDSLYPQIYRTIIHLVKMGQYNFYKDSRFFEMFAIDFLLDDNLNLYFLENNFNPQILAVSQGRADRHKKMFQDIFEIQIKYLRSRYLRIKQLAKEIKNLQTVELKKQYNLIRAKFLQINKNYLEDTYKISPFNTFQKILDYNSEGKESVNYILPDDCFSSYEPVLEL